MSRGFSTVLLNRSNELEKSGEFGQLLRWPSSLSAECLRQLKRVGPQNTRPPQYSSTNQKARQIYLRKQNKESEIYQFFNVRSGIISFFLKNTSNCRLSKKLWEKK